MKMKMPARVLLVAAIVGGVAYGGSIYLGGVKEPTPVPEVPAVQAQPQQIQIQQPVQQPVVQEAPRQADASANRGMSALMNMGKK
jgi:hypothetical protein